MRITALILAASLAGCGIGGGSAEPSHAADVDRPMGAGELVLRVENKGGLQPPLERERQLPAISIYGDGQVLVPAPVEAIFPGPAGYELEAFRIEPELVDDIVATSASIGLRGDDRQLPQEGPDFVADAGATVVTVVTGSGDRHVTSADALIEVADDADPARARLRDFVERLYALRPTDVAPARHEPQAYRVFVADPDPGFAPDPAAGVTTVEWPFPDALAGWGESLPADGLSVNVRCRVLPVDELAEAFDVLRSATATTVVVDRAGDEAIVAYRPLLPDEEGCGGGRG